MRRGLLALCAVSVVGLGTTGCVPYRHYLVVKKRLEDAKEANVDLVKKYNEAMQRLAARGNAVGGPELAELTQLREENQSLREQLQNLPGFNADDFSQLAGQGVVEEEGGLQLGEALLFAPGTAELKSAAFRVLNDIGEIMKSRYPEDMIIVEGHTDNQPLKATADKWQTNMNLGYRRALAVFNYFRDRGIPEDRMIIHSYSFNKPLDSATANSKEGRRQNRRVVVRRGGFRI